MDIETFRASRRPVTDATWTAMLGENVTDGLPREAFWEYGEGYVLHEAEGGFWPHAWWYAPVRKDTQEEAEAVLWEWRKEWV